MLVSTLPTAISLLSCSLKLYSGLPIKDGKGNKHGEEKNNRRQKGEGAVMEKQEE